MALEKLRPYSEQRDELWVSEIAKERPKLTTRPHCSVYFNEEYNHEPHGSYGEEYGHGEHKKLDLENPEPRGMRGRRGV